MGRDDQAYDAALPRKPGLPRRPTEVSTVGRQLDAGAREHLASGILSARPYVHARGTLESSLNSRRALSPRMSARAAAGRFAQRTRATSRRTSMRGPLLPNN